jgi:CHAD domain-containing protein
MSEEVAPETVPPARADDFLAPILFRLVARVRTEWERLVVSDAVADPDAIHDFRVALRRLRTALRPARELFGRRHLAEVAGRLRGFGGTTGALRDEEVLRETLHALTIPARARADLDPWLSQRGRQERSLRRRLGAILGPQLDGPSLGDVLAHLEQRLGHRREEPRTADDLAADTVTRAAADVARQLDAHPSDPTAMHELRIAYKRVRYSADLFAPLLGPQAKAVAKEAARMQRQLGELHDLDEALRRLRRSRSLAVMTRATVLRALGRARAEKARAVGKALAVERALLSDASRDVLA